MAIKQRKQLTGTTAQINAYAGVEGQLVWDKTKKKWVGMSGTAGTNYPMASESHAHSISNVTNLQSTLDDKQPKGDYATTKALTDGLAGKASKAHTHTVSQITDMPNVVLSVNNITPSSGGDVNLGLHAVATSGNYNDLLNTPTIPASPNIYVTRSESSGSNRYRVWSNGFIEQWGLLNGPGTAGGTVTFPKHFSNTTYIFVVTPNEVKAQGSVFTWYTENKTTSSITAAIQASNSSAPKQSWYAAGF